MTKYSLPNPIKTRSQRGAASIEFAILVVPLLLMLFGVTEYGRAIYQYNTLVKSVRDASRFLSAVAPGSNHTVGSCLAVYGNMSCTGSPLAKGLTTSMVSICDASNCAGTHASQTTGSGSINLVTVTVSGYTFHPLLNFDLEGFRIGAPDITYGPISNTMRQAS
jgi:Flp pilus assembly protein TadG